MKRQTMQVTLLVLVLIFKCHAAEAGILRITPFLGFTTPENRTSYGVQVGVGGGVIPIAVEGEIFKISQDHGYPSSVFYTGGLRLQPALPIPISPYLAGGIGILREDDTVSTNTFFVYNIGGGAEFKVASHISIQGEFRVFKPSGHEDSLTFKRLTIGIGLKL